MSVFRANYGHVTVTELIESATSLQAAITCLLFHHCRDVSWSNKQSPCIAACLSLQISLFNSNIGFSVFITSGKLENIKQHHHTSDNVTYGQREHVLSCILLTISCSWYSSRTPHGVSAPTFPLPGTLYQPISVASLKLQCIVCYYGIIYYEHIVH